MKKDLLKSILVAALVSIAPLHAQIPTNGLEAYYPFNGNANDENTNSYNGSVSGATLSSDRNGNPNSAYSFDGIDDVISFGHAFDFQERTVSVWFNVAEIGTNLSVMYSSDNKDLMYGMTAISFKKINNQNKIIWNIANAIDTSDISLNEWHHTVVTLNTSATSIYLDGDLVSTLNFTSYHHSPDGNLDLIGASRSLTLNYKGLIDDIRIYNRVLNSEELDSLSNEGSNTSIAKISMNKKMIKIYPNPSSGKVTLNLESISIPSAITLNILNGMGQLLRSIIIDAELSNIDLGDFNKGFYYLRLEDENGTLLDSDKLLIQ